MKTLPVALLMLGMAATCHADGALKWTDGNGGTLLLAQSDARGMEYNTYIRLKEGMSEGELLSRAGKPDADSVENLKNDIIKTYYYMPTAANPYITTVRLQGGSIISIERTKKN